MARFSVSEIANFTDSSKAKELAPKTTLAYVLVVDEDGINYAVGSNGQIKQIKEYGDILKTILLSTTTFKYQDLVNVSKVTDIEVT